MGLSDISPERIKSTTDVRSKLSKLSMVVSAVVVVVSGLRVEGECD
jgi:hypothetical protein